MIGLAIVAGPVFGVGLWIGSHMFGLASEATFRRICYALIAASAFSACRSSTACSVADHRPLHTTACAHGSLIIKSARGKFMLHRRDILKLCALGRRRCACTNSAALAQTAAKPRTKIVFLGTKGGPRIGLGRSNPANLIMVNGTPIVLDCGEGVSHQLVAATCRCNRSNTFFSAIFTPITTSNTATSPITDGRRD